MPMTAEEITTYITTALPDAKVELRDLAGDNDHWAVTVTSAAFAGKPRVAQHKMVYAAFEGKMGGVLHALQVSTKTPAGE
jgi:stress-induced morphogen